jgi:hypothetical protein
MRTIDHPTDPEIKLFCTSRRSLGQKQLVILDHLRECDICERKYWETFQLERLPLQIELFEGCTLVINRDKQGRCTMLINESGNRYQRKETK